MRPLNILGYVAMPLALAVHFLFAAALGRWAPTITFALAGLSIIPLASVMGVATEHLAEQAGPMWGGLLNATFGNAAELIIGIIAVSKGMNDIAKASLTGSILGNLLLVAGAAMVVGGWNRERQTFSRAAAETNAGLLAVAVTGMLFPAIFHFSFHLRDPHLVQHENSLSVGTSIILLAVYLLGLLFSLRTHAHIFTTRPPSTPEDPLGIAGLGGGWTIRKSVLTLLLASIAVGIFSELLVGSVERMAHELRFNRVFVGVILLAVIGNAAEHSTALLLARRNDMDTAMAISYQSSLQIALFVTPLLVILSACLSSAGMPHVQRMDLVFTPMEVAAVLLTVGTVIVMGWNGQTNWFEGSLLLAVYGILAITFFYIPMHPAEGYDASAGPAPDLRELPHGSDGK